MSNRINRFLATGLLVTSLFGAAAAQAQTALDTITQSKKVRIAVPADYPPYGFAGSDGKPQGLDVDFANLIASKLGATAEIVTVSSGNRIPYLQSRKVDVLVATLGKTPERENAIDFTYAYSPFFQALFAARSMPLKSLDDLKGKSVAVWRGSIADSELTRLNLPDVTLQRYDGHAGMASAFASGATQVLGTSGTDGDIVMRKNPALDAEFKLVLKVSPNYVGVTKGEAALKNRINEIIQDAKTSGEIDRLSSKWLGHAAGELPL